MNITILSYARSVDFGVVACERSVPHAHDIALGFADAVGQLLKIALETTPESSPLGREGTKPECDLAFAEGS